jgi:hypothetical protein
VHRRVDGGCRAERVGVIIIVVRLAPPHRAACRAPSRALGECTQTLLRVFVHTSLAYAPMLPLARTPTRVGSLEAEQATQAALRVRARHATPLTTPVESRGVGSAVGSAVGTPALTSVTWVGPAAMPTPASVFPSNMKRPRSEEDHHGDEVNCYEVRMHARPPPVARLHRAVTFRRC